MAASYYYNLAKYMVGLILKFNVKISMFLTFGSISIWAVRPVPIPFEIAYIIFFCVDFGFWSRANKYGIVGFF